MSLRDVAQVLGPGVVHDYSRLSDVSVCPFDREQGLVDEVQFLTGNLPNAALVVSWRDVSTQSQRLVYNSQTVKFMEGALPDPPIQ